jgi:putative transcriptional regulator
VVAGLLLVVLAGLYRAHAASDVIALDRGLFLIAEPTLRDPNFHETVILIIDHGALGTTGVVVNHPTETRLSSVLPDREELAGRDETLHLGGPVDRRVLLLLVRTGTSPSPEHAQHVFDNVYVTQTLDVLSDALKRDRKTAVRVFAGYAGWAPGQLEDEIARGSWRIAPADSVVLFDRDADVIWKEMIRRTSEQFI